MLYLHKILPLLFSPLGVVIFLMVYGLIQGRRSFLVLSLGVLLVGSSPFFANLLWLSLEAQYKKEHIATMTAADAVVVLGGFVGTAETYAGRFPQWGTPNRFFSAVDIVKGNKSSFLILTQEHFPWSGNIDSGKIAHDRALELGLSSSQILLTDFVSNTAEEALAVREIADKHGLETLILVTSSFHMPRAKFLFTQAGLDVVPFATDFRGSRVNFSVFEFIPSAKAFNDVSDAFRELLGRLFYSITYFVSEN